MDLERAEMEVPTWRAVSDGQETSSGPGGVLQGEGMTGGESRVQGREGVQSGNTCLLYTSDAADDRT